VGREGPEVSTLVFAHGFGLDMTAWHYQWKHFSKEYRCVLYDQRGHGRSAPALHGDYSIAALGRDLKMVIDAETGHGPVVVVGHSMGGMSILSLASQYPQEIGRRVRAVVLADTAASDISTDVLGGLATKVGTIVIPFARHLIAHPGRAYRLRHASLTKSADVAYLVTRATNFGPNAPASLVDHVARVAARSNPTAWETLMVNIAEVDLSAVLPVITVPALVLVGEVDRLTPPSAALAMQRGLPDARMFVFKKAGHCAMLERHAQFNRVVGKFIRQALQDASREGEMEAAHSTAPAAFGS